MKLAISLALLPVLFINTNAHANVCDRAPGVRDAIVKNVGASSCAQVTDRDLLQMRDLYVEGSGKNPVKGLRHLRYEDMKGLYNVKTVVFEYTYLETIEPGAFRDLWSIDTMEISHNRVSYLAPDTFCKSGAWGLNTLKNMDLDSNRPFKGKTLEKNLFWCLKNLTSLDLDTIFITHLPRDIFKYNKKLNALDIKNNKFSASEIRALKAVNNGNLELEVGVDPNDVMETWQIPERI